MGRYFWFSIKEKSRVASGFNLASPTRAIHLQLLGLIKVNHILSKKSSVFYSIAQYSSNFIRNIENRIKLNYLNINELQKLYKELGGL